MLPSRPLMEWPREPTSIISNKHVVTTPWIASFLQDKTLTTSEFPDGFPVFGSQHISSPALLPLTRCLPSGDHAIERTQFLCPEVKKKITHTRNKMRQKYNSMTNFSTWFITTSLFTSLFFHLVLDDHETERFKTSELVNSVA